LSVILSDAPRLLWAAITRRNVELLAMALDLSVPPLALLTLQAVLVWVASLLAYALADSVLPIAIASTAAVLLALSVLLSRAFYGHRMISVATLSLAAVYALRKIPLYGRFLVSRQMSWVRSKRDGE
jgi:hypothetical protein